MVLLENTSQINLWSKLVDRKPVTTDQKPKRLGKTVRDHVIASIIHIQNVLSPVGMAAETLPIFYLQNLTMAKHCVKLVAKTAAGGNIHQINSNVCFSWLSCCQCQGRRCGTDIPLCENNTIRYSPSVLVWWWCGQASRWCWTSRSSTPR